MASMKQYVLFNLFIISMMLRTALDKAISASYFADARADAGLFWGGSLLLLVVFVIGFYHVKKARQEEQPPSKMTAVLLLISGLLFLAAEVFHVQTFVGRVAAPQVPPTAKLCLALVTTVNLCALIGWMMGSFKTWREGQTKTVG